MRTGTKRGMAPRCFGVPSAVLHFEEWATNYVDYGPQNSRGFRALKVWLALRHVGAAGYRAMISDDMALSRMMAAAVKGIPNRVPDAGAQHRDVPSLQSRSICDRVSVKPSRNAILTRSIETCWNEHNAAARHSCRTLSLAVNMRCGRAS